MSSLFNLVNIFTAYAGIIINNFYNTIIAQLLAYTYGYEAKYNLHLNDAPYPWQISFQDPASPGFLGIFDLHDNIFFYLVLILIGVMWVLGAVLLVFNSTSNSLVYKYLSHGTLKCLPVNNISPSRIWVLRRLICPYLFFLGFASKSYRRGRLGRSTPTNFKTLGSSGRHTQISFLVRESASASAQIFFRQYASKSDNGCKNKEELSSRDFPISSGFTDT